MGTAPGADGEVTATATATAVGAARLAADHVAGPAAPRAEAPAAWGTREDAPDAARAGQVSGDGGNQPTDPPRDRENPSWFASTSAGGMLALGALLVGIGILLVLIGKIDRTGTIGIIGLLIAVGGVFLVPVALLRAVIGRFA